MNTYSIECFEKHSRTLTFMADSIRDAYDLAASKIIDLYDNLSEDSCKELELANINTWNQVCDKIYDRDNIDIGDIKELEND